MTLLSFMIQHLILAQAKALLGSTLVRKRDDAVIRLPITEVEAYIGEDDLACHARAGRTSRTEIMYGSAGRWYVYLVYGMHHMLNLVVGDEGYPAAILIRGAGTISGPGRLTKALSIDRNQNGTKAHPSSGLWIEDDPSPHQTRRIIATKRIGVDYAGPLWAGKKWRFVLEG